jgi:uncharacterized membrane protein YqiK
VFSNMIVVGGLAGVAVLIAVIVLFKTVWKIAEPNEALIVSGLGANGEHNVESPSGNNLDSLGFKIVVGRGTLVLPGFQTVRRLALESRSTGLSVNAVSNQSIPLTVKGIVAYKVGDDMASIANAARRFLDQDNTVMQATIHELFAGHLRAIVGGMSVEDMLHNREALTAKIRESLGDDLAALGLRVDSLQIQEIDDDSGYIKNLGKPQAAEVEAKARIAAANRDQEATEAEQIANAKKAAAVRDSEIKQSEFQAERDKASSTAAQAGPLAEAQAKQEVVRAETQTAELNAARQEKILETEVRKPADAEAYRQVKLAEAAKESRIAAAQAAAEETTLAGDAEAKATAAVGTAAAEAIKAKGLAEAAGIEARAKALSENQDAVIAQQIAEHYPEIVAAGASAMSNIDNMVVLNGAEGMADVLGQTLTMGGAGFGLAKSLIDAISNKDKDAPAVSA